MWLWRIAVDTIGRTATTVEPIRPVAFGRATYALSKGQVGHISDAA
ncbi:hypothetical protein [Phytohabitans rumicis]|nr:hypothetical protein [Phytohabitans rumicis]